MADTDLPAKRKRTLNSKLTSKDNVHKDAVKRRQGLPSKAKITTTTSRSSRQASLEAIDDDEEQVRRNAGPPNNPNSILEATDEESDDKGIENLVKRCKHFHPQTKTMAMTSCSSHQASVKAIDDDEDHLRCNAGPPKNTNSILEATGDEKVEEQALQEETDEQELGNSTMHTLFDLISHSCSPPPEGLAISYLRFLSPRR